MEIRFIGIDPETPGNQCPAVFVDDENGDILFQGTTETNADVLARVAESSPIADYESVVRLPRRMQMIILEAVLGADTVRRLDLGSHLAGAASGDA